MTEEKKDLPVLPDVRDRHLAFRIFMDTVTWTSLLELPEGKGGEAAIQANIYNFSEQVRTEVAKTLRSNTTADPHLINLTLHMVQVFIKPMITRYGVLHADIDDDNLAKEYRQFFDRLKGNLNLAAIEYASLAGYDVKVEGTEFPRYKVNRRDKK